MPGSNRRPTARVELSIQELTDIRVLLQRNAAGLKAALDSKGGRPSERAMTSVDLEHTQSALKKIRAAEHRAMRSANNV